MKCRNVCLLFLLAAVLVFIPGWSAAVDQNATSQGPATGALRWCEKQFQSLDKNHDGKLTKEELQADNRLGKNIDQFFRATEPDKKGWLTEEEFCKSVGQGKTRGGDAMGCKARFEALDTNHDGVLSREEVKAADKTGGKLEQLFKQKDVNGDGKLTLEEFCGSGKTQKPPMQ